nr:type II secretion system protein [Rossellomorea aquimaris]
MKLRKMLKNERGLTLVELLAVIVILGIIAAIAVPSIGGIIDKTKEDAKVAEAIQIINAAKLAHASDSEITQWKHDADNSVTPAYGGLKEYLSNVDDVDYIVKYSNGIYTISGHDSAKVVNASYKNKKAVPESELLEVAK